MSSDRLSFNQGADGEDDGARWEAYLALLRRNKPSDPIGANGAGNLTDDPLRRGDGAVSADLPAPTAGAGSVRRNSHLVVWTMAVTAAIILAVLLVERPHDRRDARTQIQPTPSQARPGPSSHNGLVAPAAVAAAPIAPPLSAPPPASAPTIVQAGLARAPSHRRPQAASGWALRLRGEVTSAGASYQPPQCWTSIPGPDNRAGEARLTDCPSDGSLPERTTTILRWQATPDPPPAPRP